MSIDSPIPSHPVEVIHIHTDVDARLVARPNRFIAIAEIEKDGSKEEVMVHVHDPGRLTDILYPGNRILLRKANDPKRKTGWDLIAGRLADEWILINSAFHGQISRWAIEHAGICLFKDIDSILPEQRYGNSRIDHLIVKNGMKIWTEVKGCTLADKGIASFPDAPTTRGKRHVEELMHALTENHEAALLILIFRPEAICFTANEGIDPEFARTFYSAIKAGVNVFPLRFSFDGKVVYYHGQLPICGIKQ